MTYVPRQAYSVITLLFLSYAGVLFQRRDGFWNLEGTLSEGRSTPKGTGITGKVSTSFSAQRKPPGGPTVISRMATVPMEVSWVAWVGSWDPWLILRALVHMRQPWDEWVLFGNHSTDFIIHSVSKARSHNGPKLWFVWCHACKQTYSKVKKKYLLGCKKRHCHQQGRPACPCLPHATGWRGVCRHVKSLPLLCHRQQGGVMGWLSHSKRLCSDKGKIPRNVSTSSGEVCWWRAGKGSRLLKAIPTLLWV